MILCLSNFHKKISEVLNKPDQGLLAAEKDKEIHVLYFTLQEVCKYAFMVEGTLESSHPESWIKKTEEKYFKL